MPLTPGLPSRSSRPTRRRRPVLRTPRKEKRQAYHFIQVEALMWFSPGSTPPRSCLWVSEARSGGQSEARLNRLQAEPPKSPQSQPVPADTFPGEHVFPSNTISRQRGVAGITEPPCAPHGMCQGLREWRAIRLPVCAEDTAVCGPCHPGLQTPPDLSGQSLSSAQAQASHGGGAGGRAGGGAAGGREPPSQAASTPPGSPCAHAPRATGHLSFLRRNL